MRRVLFIVVLVAVGIVIAAPLFGRSDIETPTSDVDWITADDISEMPQTTIRYWYEESVEGTALGEAQIAEFMEMFPNITVVGSTAPEAVDNEMLLPYLKTQNHAHVHQSVNNEDLWYIDNDLLFPLDSFPDFQEQWDRLLPQFNYVWEDDHVYSLSWYFAPMLLYYNTEVIRDAGLDPDDPPETYSEFFEWAEAIMVRNDAGDVVRWTMAPWIGEDWWYWEFMVYPFYYNATGTNQYVNEAGTEVTITSDMGRKMYEFWDVMFRNEYAARTSFEMNPFTNGQIAIALEGPWNVPTIESDAPPGFEYTVGHLPRPDESTVMTPRTWALVRNFALIPDVDLSEEETARTMRASWELMKFLLSDEQMAADYAITGNFPAAKAVTTDPIFTDITAGYGDKMREVLEAGVAGYIDGMDTLDVVEINYFFQQAFLRVAYGEMTVDEAVAYAAEESNKILQSR